MTATEPSPFDRPDLYDALLDDLDSDLPFWLEFARAGRGPVLEVACGTGRILVRLLEAGLEVDGLDESAPMLQHARGKVAILGHRAALTRAPMQDFALPRRYARILCAFNSFAHLLTQRDQIAALACCRAHLAPGGEFALHLSFPHPQLWLSHGKRELELEKTLPDGRRLRLYDTRTMDPVAQTQLSVNEIEELDAGGALRARVTSRTALRWVYQHELALLLAHAGFGDFAIYGDFARNPLTATSDSMVVVARRD